MSACFLCKQNILCNMDSVASW